LLAVLRVALGSLINPNLLQGTMTKIKHPALMSALLIGASLASLLVDEDARRDCGRNLSEAEG
jgi:hypothetical protein